MSLFVIMKLLTTNTKNYLFSKNKGFTLIETLIGVAVFLLIAVSAWQAFGVILEGTKVLRIKSASINLANEKIEIVHNLPYADVGIVGGLPLGKIPHEQIVETSGGSFLVTTTIRNIDEDFDGTIGGSPNDLSPADNKLVEIEVRCANDCGVAPISISTRIAPFALETTGNNGALFVQVFNSNGLPLEGADVHIVNSTITPNITIDDVTASNGMLQIVDAPTSTEAYEITVTKDGYSTDKTYAYGDSLNPVPDKIHATVVSGGVTQVSFAIDELSNITVSSRTDSCSSVGNIDFSLTGSKVIGLDTFKYDVDHITNSSGNLSINDLEWDSYAFDVIDSSYDLAGSNSILPLDLIPGATQHVDLIVSPKNPNALLVKVIDGATSLPLADADVTLESGTFLESDVTGRGFLLQTDWSGGAGQDNFTNETQYFSSDGNIETNSPSGEIKLVNFSGSYISDGILTSSIFDTGTTTNFHTLEWLPGSQPVEAGIDSVRLQVSTNLLNTPSTIWDFIGPDGTSNSYFTTSGQQFNASHSGDRFIRYKTFLSTESSINTPSISEISFTFSSECTPAGQAFFNNLDSGDYTLTVEKNGYQTFIQENLSINTDWRDVEIILTP